MNLSCESLLIMLLVLSDQSRKEIKMDGIGGPFLQMAVFCEKVLQEKDGVMSAIRIVDRFMHTLSGAQAPDSMPPLRIDVSLLIGIKSGNFRGKKQLKITPTAPSGQVLPGFSGPILLQGDDHGAAIVVRYLFEAKEEGLYWFTLELDGEFLTKLPLRIIYQKTAVTSTTIPPVH